jgi:hypothetical protein
VDVRRVRHRCPGRDRHLDLGAGGLLVDCLQVPDDSLYRTGTKLIWVLVIVLAQFIGAVIYLTIGRPGSGARRAPPSNLPPPPGR